LAFLPQFVDPATSHRTLAFVLLGGTFVVTGTTWGVVVALLSARASQGFRRSAHRETLVRRVAGGVFLGLGVRLALERSR